MTRADFIVNLRQLPAYKTILYAMRGDVGEPGRVRLFHLRSRLAHWIAPPLPLGQRLTVTVDSRGKVQVQVTPPLDRW